MRRDLETRLAKLAPGPAETFTLITIHAPTQAECDQEADRLKADGIDGVLICEVRPGAVGSDVKQLPRRWLTELLRDVNASMQGHRWGRGAHNNGPIAAPSAFR